MQSTHIVSFFPESKYEIPVDIWVYKAPVWNFSFSFDFYENCYQTERKSTHYANDKWKAPTWEIQRKKERP